MQKKICGKQEKGWDKKNGTEQCKNYDSPISPSDQQASTTISGGCTPFIHFERSETLLGFGVQEYPRMTTERTLGRRKQDSTPAVST